MQFFFTFFWINLLETLQSLEEPILSSTAERSKLKPWLFLHLFPQPFFLCAILQLPFQQDRSFLFSLSHVIHPNCKPFCRSLLECWFPVSLLHLKFWTVKKLLPSLLAFRFVVLILLLETIT